MGLTPRNATVLFGAGALLVASACQRVEDAGGPADPVRKLVEQRVPEYLQRVANLPPTVTLRVLEVQPSIVPGLLSVTLELSQGTQTQKYPVTVSRDGRYLIQGKVSDMTRDPQQENVEKIVLAGQPMRGNSNATVTIVEYSDFQCPFCAQAYQTLESQVLKEYGDRVRLVFKHLPLTAIHPWAQPAAIAASCARQQSPEGFWKLYDFFFQNQKEITAENLKEKARGAAQQAGLDVAQFDVCVDSPAARDQVKADGQEALALGVRSTPTFFINGQKVEGAVTFEQFKAAIDHALGVPTTPPAAASVG